MSDEVITVLLVDDDEDDFIMFRDLLSQIIGVKFKIEWAPSFETGHEALLKNAHMVCFLDFRLGIRTGLDLLNEAIHAGIKTPMILLTGYGEHEVDLEAMRVGAADYLIKDEATPYLIERSIRYSIHRAQAKEALREREIQVLMQDRLASVGLLASSLAHEIGTPLGVIRGRAEYLALQLHNDPNTVRNVDIIISQIDRVSKLIRSLLNLARGDQARHSEVINLNEVVEEVLELMAHELRKHGIEIKNQIDQMVPLRVFAEAGPLHQVLLNLIVNSVHAIESAIQGGRTTGHFIQIGVKSLAKEWVFSLQDSGCGISKANMLNLFRPFFTTKDIGVGTGLGLATSYGIVESWGGKIQVESQENEGTTFSIFLPKK